MGGERGTGSIEYDGLNMMLGFKIDWILGENMSWLPKRDDFDRAGVGCGLV